MFNYLIILQLVFQFSFTNAITEKQITTNHYLTSQSGISFIGDNCLVLSSSGLTIYEMNRDSLKLINSISIPGLCNGLTIFYDFAYISTFENNQIYKVKIGDLNKLLLTDSIKIKGGYFNFMVKDKLLVNGLVGSNWEINMYSKEGFYNEVIKEKVPMNLWPLRKLNDTLQYIKTNRPYLHTYKLDSTNTIIPIDSIPIDNLSFPNNFELFNDSILIAGSDENGIELYNIKNHKKINSLNKGSEIFKSNGNNLFAVKKNYLYCYGLESLSSIGLLDSLKMDYDKILNIGVSRNNNVVLTTKKGKLVYIKLINNKFKLLSSTGMGGFTHCFAIANKTYLNTSNQGLFLVVSKNKESIDLIPAKKHLPYFETYDFQVSDEYIVETKLDQANKTVVNELFKVGENGQLYSCAVIDTINGLLYPYENNFVFTIEKRGLIRFKIIDDRLSLDTVINLNSRGGTINFNGDRLIIASQNTFFIVENIFDNNIQIKDTLFSPFKHPTHSVFFKNYLIVSDYVAGNIGTYFYKLNNENELEYKSFIQDNGYLFVDKDKEQLFICNSHPTTYDISKIDLEGAMQIEQPNMRRKIDRMCPFNPEMSIKQMEYIIIDQSTATIIGFDH